MVAVFVVPDFPWWFVFVLAALSAPWWAGGAMLGACLPQPGRHWRWRVGGALTGGVVTGLAALGVYEVTDAAWGSTAAVYRRADQLVWAANGLAAAAAVWLVVHRRHRPINPDDVPA